MISFCDNKIYPKRKNPAKKLNVYECFLQLLLSDLESSLNRLTFHIYFQGTNNLSLVK